MLKLRWYDCVDRVKNTSSFRVKDLAKGVIRQTRRNIYNFLYLRHGPPLSPSRRREAPCEGTNSPRLFTPGETKALAKSKVHQLSRASVTNDGGSSSLISKIWRTVMSSGH
jgi:hypothetical protein